jgi:hypothetical protein
VQRTRDVFGNPIRPRLFRNCAVTEPVDFDPDQIEISHDLLGHIRTTSEHYIMPRAWRRMSVPGGITARHRWSAARRSSCV